MYRKFEANYHISVDYSYHLFCLTNIPFTIYVSKYRAIIILVIRKCCIIVIPLIASIFISGNCGNHWTEYWNDCTQNKNTHFDITYFGVSPVLPPSNWNKCLRFYTSHWSSVLMTKIVDMMFLPFIMIGFKTIKHKIFSSKYICNKFKKHSLNDIAVDINKI